MFEVLLYDQKCQNYGLQTSPWHHEEETQNKDCRNQFKDSHNKLKENKQPFLPQQDACLTIVTGKRNATSKICDKLLRKNSDIS